MNRRPSAAVPAVPVPGPRASGWNAFSAAARGVAQTLAIVLAVVALGAGVGSLGRTLGAYPGAMSEADAQLTDDGEHWLVDGFNVLHTAILSGRERGRWWQEEGRRRLLERVSRFDAGRAAVLVVFDGDRPAGEPEDASGVRVVFAPSADEWLLRAVRRCETPGHLNVVTADRALADRARRNGAEVVAPRAFLARCPS